MQQTIPIKKRTFLDAQWRKLIMMNYAVDPELLKPYLPFETELDLWNGTCYVSLVGFMFKETKMLKMRIPFHVNFEEINLRFYVKYKDTDGYKRGVVFIKEIVPMPSLTMVANALYKENYETLPTRHLWEEKDDSLTVKYIWKKDGRWNIIKTVSESKPVDITEGSEEEFITEHFWGYTRINENVTSEYEVVHPRWQVYSIKDHSIRVNFKSTYGPDFAFMQNLKPVSVYLAEGSEILVKQGRKIKVKR
ncbi:DUF2071 domain-containing protein [Flavobacterium sp. DG1-102-2]|uniref:YqjF family protein n=1 Tax=Flavobacterium sp. DG1-102-2 TaxID=3081663 RepID=UPI002949652F|nr:DUF2071 domain-containing protein [Flavobacterium sp. DG1-102-2]MDV6170083.1 DUF2071 domain-containing protein [Flavobacterium sp. DG1-102-2]